MSDRGAAQIAVQTEQRHQVDRREGVGGHVVEVGEVRGVQAGGVHQVGEQLLVNSIATACAIFVEFDRDKRRLRLPDQPRDRERVRVALLEVIQRPVHEVLAHLLPGAVVSQVVGRARPSTGSTDNAAIASAAVSSLRSHRRRRRTALRNASSRRPRRLQQRPDPIPSARDPGEPAVVQFVADVQGQLQIESVWVGFAEWNVDWPGMQRRPAALKGVDDRGRKRTDGAGELGFDGGRRQSHAGVIPQTAGPETASERTPR